ncbi:hypothetical protein [Streptomyces nigrescens]
MVRETVWGGCTRRALDARTRAAEADRGAWVQGCLDGVANKSAAPPTATVTKREENTGLLRSFRAWADAHERRESARHASKLTTVRLTARDYDIELVTDYGPDHREEAQELARHFVTWWDGDHGGEGIARNVLVMGGDGRRLLHRRI